MDLQGLSSRAVIGAYYAALEMGPMAWVEGVSNFFESDQSSETYPMLGMVPRLSARLGPPQPKPIRAFEFSIRNQEYNVKLDIPLRDLRRDKTGQVLARISEFAAAQQSHWASLLSTLALNGPSTACYDGQFFFDTDHSEGDSGTQDNDITVDISTMPAEVHGVVTAPSVEEMQHAILKGISQILSFKDDHGEPVNENAKAFLVMVPTSLYITAVAAVAPLALLNAAKVGNINPNLVANLSIQVAMNARLTWTDSFAVFRTDRGTKAFIRQSETGMGVDPNEVKLKDENSEYAIDNLAIQLVIDVSRNVGYGDWRNACYVTMT